ncbi:alpha/beta hydrolase-fold protein [Winogradskyella pelagia]|nr:alpha/beta hydrolase-fold protein [Winogradskyella sp. DF17]
MLLSSQSYQVYSNDVLKLYSEQLRDSINLNLHKPESLGKSGPNIKFPVTIIFDSQHKMTYPRIINTFDFLSIDALIPETIIVGVPFNFNNRTYLTSDQRKEGDSLMGIERMERFLFKELIPKLKSEFKANDFLMIIGHSRTAFLVNYLLTKQSSNINVAVALSGFYKEHPLNEGFFEDYLGNNENFPRPTQYFITAGTSAEETSYKTENDALSTYFSNASIAKNLDLNYSTNAHATHMVNFWMSIPQILLNSYEEYGLIINNWLFNKLEDATNEQPIEEFKSDLTKLNEKLSLNANPSITHIFSFASHYLNTKDYSTAIDFVSLGLDYYPDYLDFYPLIIELFQQSNDEKNRNKYIEIYKKKIAADASLSDPEKNNRLKSY